MSEKTVAEHTRKILKDRGFFCLKYSDTSRSGIPDMTISGNGKTMHVEDKITSVQFGLTKLNNLLEVISLSAKDFISPDRIVQMVTMCKLERKTRAEYWIYIECDGKYYVAVVEPRKVFESYMNNLQIKMIVTPINQFRQKFEI